MTETDKLKNLNITVEVVNGDVLFRLIGGLADGIAVRIFPNTAVETAQGISIEYNAQAVPDDQAIKDEIEKRISELVNMVLHDYLQRNPGVDNEDTV